MARPGISYLDVARVAVQLNEQGLNPTVAEVRKVLNTGSNSTINRHLRDWEEKQGHRMDAEKGLPASLLTVVKGLYDALGEEAEQKIHAAKQALEQQSAVIETKLTQATQANQILRDTNTQLNNKIAALNEHRERLQTKQQELQQNLVQQQSENQAKTICLEDKAKEIERIAKQIKHAQDNLDHYRESMRQQREQEQQAYHTKLNQLENKQEENTKIISELKCVLATKNKGLEQLSEHHKALKKSVDLLSEKKSKQDEFLQKTQWAFESLEKSYRQLEMNDRKKTDERDKLMQVNSDLTIQMATLKEKISHYHTSVAKAEDKINQLQDEKLFMAQKNSELEHQVKFINS